MTLGRQLQIEKVSKYDMYAKMRRYLLAALAIIVLLFCGESFCQDSEYVCSTISAQMKDHCTLRRGKEASGGFVDVGAGSGNTTRHQINIWVMVPFDDNLYMFSRYHVKPAVYRALNDANATLCGSMNESNVNHDLSACYSVYINDTECNADYTLTEVVEIKDSSLLADKCGTDDDFQHSQDMDVIVGVTCDYSAGRVGTLATSWNWPTLFPGTRTTSLNTKSETCCETLTRPGLTATDLGEFVYQLYKKHGWNNSYLVYTNDKNHGAPVHYNVLSDCSTYVSGIVNVFGPAGYKYHLSKNNLLDEDLLNDDTVKSLLKNIRDTARVSLWCVGRKAMRYIMNTAHDLGMTSNTDPDEQFAFFYLDLYNTNTSYEWSDTDDLPCTQPGYCDQNMGESMRGFEALEVISLYQPQTPEYKSFSSDMQKEMGPILAGTDQFINPFVTQYYDSIRLLVNGVRKAIAENITDFSDGAAFANLLWNTSFQSVDGIVAIAENGDRLMDYSVMDMDESGLFQTAEIFYRFNSSWVSVTEIDWPGTKPPPNIPPCGVYDCPTLSQTIVILISFACVLFVCLLATLYIAHRKVTRERNMRKMAWKVKPEDVIFTQRGRRLSNSTGSTVSEVLISGATNRQLFTRTAEWKQHFGAVKQIVHARKITVDRKLQLEMEQMMSLDHEHICKFIGASVEEPVMILTEYCSRGSLQDFLEGDVFEKLDDVFRNSLISDIAHGMNYLHKSSIRSHGNLKSSNCLLNSRLVVKIADFGLSTFRFRKRRDSVIGYNHHKDLLWTAPELFRAEEPLVNGTQKGDVYSFAIIVQEILYRMGAFYMGENDEILSPTEICERLKATPSFQEFFRPTLEDNDEVVVDARIRNLVQECWAENSELRPSFQQIVIVMKKYSKRQNLFDRMLTRLEQYSTTLEDKVDERTRQYKAEKERADLLLYQMLPQTVADRLKRGQDVLPDKCDSVTIYFSDIVGFTAISHDSTPFEVVAMLDRLYTTFDGVVDCFDVYKVETIGDAYMVVSGLPEKNGKNHVREIARMSLDLIEEVKRFKIPHMPDRKLQLRVGIHSGPVVAGVVGQKMPRYCLFGDTVNTAARMEQSGKGLKIHISPATKSLLDEFEHFIVTQRDDEVNLKGLGNWKTWWLDGEFKKVCEVSANTEAISDHPNEKKNSSSSDYSSARSSIQSEISSKRTRQSVTGADDNSINTDYARAGLKLSSLATYESVCEEPSQYSVLVTEGFSDGEKEKRRRRGISDIPESLAVNIPHLHHDDSRDCRRFEKKYNTEKSNGQRKVQFNAAVTTNGGLDETLTVKDGKKEKSRDFVLEYHNSAFASEDNVTKM